MDAYAAEQQFAGGVGSTWGVSFALNQQTAAIPPYNPPVFEPPALPTPNITMPQAQQSQQKAQAPQQQKQQSQGPQAVSFLPFSNSVGMPSTGGFTGSSWMGPTW